MNTLIKGRIHQAVVTQLHPQSNSVSVEWCERNETKGKEIELEALYALNQALLVGFILFSIITYNANDFILFYKNFLV